MCIAAFAVLTVVVVVAAAAGPSGDLWASIVRRRPLAGIGRHSSLPEQRSGKLMSLITAQLDSIRLDSIRMLVIASPTIVHQKRTMLDLFSLKCLHRT